MNVLLMLVSTGASFLFLCLVFRPLEMAFPAKRGQRFFRPEWWTDLLFFLGQYLLWTSLVISLLVLAWSAFDRSAASHRAFRYTMLLFMMAGAAGMWFHARADAPVEPPVLAPGAMIQLGVLGLLERWSRELRHKIKADCIGAAVTRR